MEKKKYMKKYLPQKGQYHAMKTMPYILNVYVLTNNEQV